jgi:hypothetical protein
MIESVLKRRSTPQVDARPRKENSTADVKQRWVETRIREIYGETAAEDLPPELVALVLRLGRAN